MTPTTARLVSRSAAVVLTVVIALNTGAVPGQAGPAADVTPPGGFIAHQQLLAAVGQVDADAVASAGTFMFPQANGVTGGAFAVDDIDGDGAGDLVVVDEPVQAPAMAGDGASVTFTAETLDGQTLWTTQVPGQIGVVLDAATGTDAIVIATASVAGSGNTSRLTLHLRGVGADGTVLWAQDPVGVMVNNTYRQLPRLAGTGRGPDDRDTILLSLLDRTAENTRELPVDDAVTVRAIDAGTGEVAGEATATGLGFGVAWPAGDLDGDGVDDAAVAFSSIGAQAGDLVALGLGAGSELWAVRDTPSVELFGHVAAVGDTDGDGLDDVATGGGTVVGVAKPKDGVALYGGNGEMLWQQDGQYAAAVGDIDGDGLSDVVVRTFEINQVQPASLIIHTDAYRGDGTAVYEQREATHIAANDRVGASLLVSHGAEDIDGDGVWDLRHDGYTTADDVPGENIGGVISGRTGERLFTSSSRFVVDLTDDHRGVLQFEQSTSTVLTATLTDQAGVQRWTAAVTFTGPVDNVSSGTPVFDIRVSDADVDGDGINDIALSASIAGPQSVVRTREHTILTGSDGAQLR